VIGSDDLDGRLAGIPLTWPLDIDGTDPRPETILVLVTSSPQDVSVLQQDGVRGPDQHRGAAQLADGSSLERLLAQFATGGFRDLPAGGGRATRYDVHTIGFQLNPALPPEPEVPTFLIDERPDPSVRLAGRRGPTPEPPNVAVRLNELVVHNNRALRSANIRVDAIVLTGSGGVEPVYRAGTARFSNVLDGDRLPLDDMLVYHGPAIDFLDIAVWVSRDRADSLSLSDMLRQQLTDAEVQAAALQLAGLTIATPQAATAVAAIGAGAVIVNLAYRFLSRVVGDNVGLYRTSLLAHEGFGLGRHPARGSLRAQDFSFAYTIDDVGGRLSVGISHPSGDAGRTGSVS
jgi:hypothetical protein